MARDADTPDIDELELGGDDAPEIDPNEPQEGDEDIDPTVNDEEETLTFGDDSQESDGDSNLVKHLRQQIKERDKRIAEAARTAPQPQKIEVGPKPTLAGCEYDEERYDAERDAWEERKAAAARQDSAATQAGEQEAQAWTAELQRYTDGKSKLQFTDVDDAEETVKASLDTAQQAVLIMSADDPARLAYALGKHPAKLAELAAEKNPLKLAAKIARLEGQLKVTKGRRTIDPDTPERGSAKISRESADKTLAKLEAQADKTGDRTAVIAYRRKLKAKDK